MPHPPPPPAPPSKPCFPPTFIIPFRLSLDELHALERALGDSNVFDAREAHLVVGNLTQKRRAEHELRTRGVRTVEVVLHVGHEAGGGGEARVVDVDVDVDAASRAGRRMEAEGGESLSSSRKRRKTSDHARPREDHGLHEVDDESTASEDDAVGGTSAKDGHPSVPADPCPSHDRLARSVSPATTVDGGVEINAHGIIRVLNIEWFRKSMLAGELLPMKEYLIYEGYKLGEQVATSAPSDQTPPPAGTIATQAKDVYKRAAKDVPAETQSQSAKYASQHSRTSTTHRPAFLTETTSEHDITTHLPPIPAYLHTRYSCQRPTPLHSPNAVFVALLKKIQHFRTLASEDISVRAYSSAIGTLSSYPYTLSTYAEVHSLPGCGDKIALLFNEWRTTGVLEELTLLEADESLRIKHLFYHIHGVGAITAREWYHRGWRDLDDVTRHWDELTREQQVGLKFYDDFCERIPRAEVARIARIVLAHANALRPGFHMVVAGGYRRGQETSGDVDVVLTHRDEQATLDLITPLVERLHAAGWVTHTLKVTTTNSRRAQAPVSWKGEARGKHGGFDTLDSAFLAWRELEGSDDGHGDDDKDDLDNLDATAAATTKPTTKPRLHRRLDIIISPWKTAGCAVLGWSGGTTFQRDLRLYCQRERGLKFDSSGVRERRTGRWVDVERADGDEDADDDDARDAISDEAAAETKGKKTQSSTKAAHSGVDADGGPVSVAVVRKEKRVFRFLGLEWREPGERCTG